MGKLKLCNGDCLNCIYDDCIGQPPEERASRAHKNEYAKQYYHAHKEYYHEYEKKRAAKKREKAEADAKCLHRLEAVLGQCT